MDFTDQTRKNNQSLTSVNVDVRCHASEILIIAEENRNKSSVLEETPIEWVQRAISDLYDPTVPPSETKTRFGNTFLRTQTNCPLPPPDSAWVSSDSPNKDCDRCRMHLAHLVEFCPSILTDFSRPHPPVTVWNAFTTWDVPDDPMAHSSVANRPGTPYPHLREYNKHLHNELPIPPVPMFATSLTQHPSSYNGTPALEIVLPKPRYTLRNRNIYPKPTTPRIIPQSAHPDSPRHSSDFSQFLDGQILDALYDARNQIVIDGSKYLDISDAGPAAYYSDPDTPMKCRPFIMPPEIQHYPERPKSDISIPSKPYPNPHSYFDLTTSTNPTWILAFAGYLEELVYDQMNSIRRAIGGGYIHYPDLDRTDNPAYHIEVLANGEHVLRIPGFDNLVETLHTHWSYTLFSPDNIFSFPHVESWFHDLYSAWDYLPKLIN
ncbi:hypothetical protein B0H11DRAFT_2230516 [Mycena galericulata]|nr:hypothetical protein B0H11DRAFT_2230516 [Mycena galericulata]